MDHHDDGDRASGRGRAVRRRAGPVLALVALGWVLKKLLSRTKD